MALPFDHGCCYGGCDCYIGTKIFLWECEAGCIERVPEKILADSGRKVKKSYYDGSDPDKQIRCAAAIY